MKGYLIKNMKRKGKKRIKKTSSIRYKFINNLEIKRKVDGMRVCNELGKRFWNYLPF